MLNRLNSHPTLNPQASLEIADAIARDVQLRLLLIFQPDDHAAVNGWKQLLNEADVDDGRAVDSDEAARIELLLELCERVVDCVLASVRDRQSQFVLREEMTDARGVENRRALADARRNPFEPPARRELGRELAREHAHIRGRTSFSVADEVGSRPEQSIELVERPDVAPGALAIPSEASSPKSIARRARSSARPCPSSSAAAPNPGPSSRTSICTRFLRPAAWTVMDPPSRRGETAYLTLFSTSVCTASRGTRLALHAWSTSIAYRSRSPNRTRSISR